MQGMEFIGSCQLSVMTHYNSAEPHTDRDLTALTSEVKGEERDHPKEKREIN